MANYYAKVSGLEVETRNFSMIAAGGELVVASYDELQRYPAGGNSRRSTVVFVTHADSAYGHRRRHAQETWLDAGGAKAAISDK